MGRHLRRTLDQEGIATRHAIVDVPRDQAILKTLTLPVGQPDELPGIVEIQIAKELPFPASQAIIEFAVTTVAEEQVTGDVLVAAIRRELLEDYEATFAEAGLKLDRVGLRPHANKVAVCELLRHAIPDGVLFIDVRPTFMEIDVLKNSALSFSRSASVTIPEGLGDAGVVSITAGTAPGAESAEADTDQAGTDLGSVVRSLMLEVTRSIEAYRQGDPGATIDHVVIGGDVGVEEALADAIGKRWNLTTEFYNPARTFGWEPDEGAGAAGFSAALGLVLGYAADGAEHFDFLHPKKTVSVTQQRLKKAPLVAAVVALFLGAGGVGLAEYSRSDRQELAKLEKRIGALKRNRVDNKRFLELVQVINEFDSGQHVWIDVLRDVMSVLPSNEEFVLTRVELKQSDGVVTLKTKAKRRDIPTSVLRELHEFRRNGCPNQRFEVTLGSETEKRRERYPHHQKLRIKVLDDGPCD